jgi:hypothetical protein
LFQVVTEVRTTNTKFRDKHGRIKPKTDPFALLHGSPTQAGLAIVWKARWLP